MNQYRRQSSTATPNIGPVGAILGVDVIVGPMGDSSVDLTR